MRGDALIDVVVAGVLDQVADIVCRRRCPVAPVRADELCALRVAAGVKAENLVGPHSAARQHHIDGRWIGLWRLQRSGHRLRVLLGKDGLLVKLIIERVGKEVATRGEVG